MWSDKIYIFVCRQVYLSCNIFLKILIFLNLFISNWNNKNLKYLRKKAENYWSLDL